MDIMDKSKEQVLRVLAIVSSRMPAQHTTFYTYYFICILQSCKVGTLHSHFANYILKSLNTLPKTLQPIIAEKSHNQCS